MKDKVNKQKDILRKEAEKLRRESKSFRAKLTRRDKKVQQLKAEKEEELWRNNPSLKDEPIRNHSYGTLIVTLSVLLFLHTSMSVRSIAKTIEIFCDMLGYKQRCPHHTTIHLWLRKMGYSLAKENPTKSPVVIMMDESIEVGKEKLFVVTCTKLEDFRPGDSLKINDSRIIFMGVRSSWTGEEIAKKLTPILSEMNVAYVLSDKGPNLKKAVKELGYKHVFDFTHEIALQLKYTYAKDVEFQNFTSWLGEMRKKLSNSKHSEWLPPKMRHKARFHDLSPHIKWVKKVSSEVISKENQDSALVEKLQGATDHLEIVSELSQILDVAFPILHTARHEGMEMDTTEKMLWKLLDLKGERPELFGQRMINFIANSFPEAGESRPFVCTDSLESFFGKFKVRISQHPEKSFTNITLTAPLIFLKKEDEKNLSKRMEEVKVVEIRKKDVLERLYETASEVA